VTLLYDVRLEYDWIIKLYTVEVKEEESEYSPLPGQKTPRTRRREERKEMKHKQKPSRTLLI
jgi:hypothetical protein